jgi:hypothetical protein
LHQTLWEPVFLNVYQKFLYWVSLKSSVDHDTKGFHHHL